MSDQLVIRPAYPEESATLSELAIRSKAVWGYSNAFMELCRDELTLSPEQINAPHTHYFVAEANDQLFGFYALDLIHHTDHDYELDALFIEPKCIGLGVGTTLLEHAKQHALALGGKRLLIHSDPYAKGFYKAAGAEYLGQRQSGSIPNRYLPVYAITLI